MAREWKTGDVALFRVDRWSSASEWPDDTSQVLMQADDDGRYWYAVDGDPSAPFCVPPQCRTYMHPLVVIDPEDREQVARLADAFCLSRWDHIPGGSECDPLTRSSMQEALRECADPKPRIEEPTGLGAVVEDEGGDFWVYTGQRNDVDRRIWNHGHQRVSLWSNIAAVKVLSEGVS